MVSKVGGSSRRRARLVDSRAKGARGEYQVRDLLRKYTGLGWERTPSSGALSYLKADLYVPHKKNVFSVEVKNYQEPILDIKVFTNKSSNFTKFWAKVEEDAKNMEQEPLLVFKHARSKWFLATKKKPKKVTKYWYISWLDCYVLLFEDFLQKEDIQWLSNLSNSPK